ncbi:hypothetical protein CDCA_CDCA10G3033 [Cyanidium caldarium]|uniref:Protein kinase domain-containing protein n=1 Tax=Cyanidium caldarium TaxID=2771 RepID=A0AAV9IY29_CYACA|nr:hypothetical protein CDCA_CDCA10G3033 [Cyanidium caldarium]
MSASANHSPPQEDRDGIEEVLDTDACQIQWDELHVEREIGRGTGTTVYSGVWRDHAVAVKVLNEGASRQTRDIMRKEVAFVTQRLGRHPHILTYYGWGTRRGDDCPFLVMELFEGGGPIHRKRKALHRKPRLVYSLMLQVASALSYMHQHHLVHRDLKPSNVLVDQSLTLAKLSDFGVSRAKERSDAQMTTMTGTFQWMAPEVISGSSYDFKADVYSFGVLFNELLTGTTPYQEKYLTPVQIATAVVTKGLRPRLVRSGTDIPPSVPQRIERCWAQESSRRPTSAELVEALQQLVKEYPMDASTVATSTKLSCTQQ